MCDNLRVCQALDCLIKDSKRNDLGSYAATAVPGGRKRLEYCDLSGVRGKNIIYIPAPTRASYSAALEYGEKCLKAGAASFTVLCGPVLLRPLTIPGCFLPLKRPALFAPSADIPAISPPAVLPVVPKKLPMPTEKAPACSRNGSKGNCGRRRKQKAQ